MSSYKSASEALREWDEEMAKNPLRWLYRHGFPGSPYNLMYHLKRPWTLITELPVNLYREIKYSWQRGKRGWSDRDSWNIDAYLCSWMPSALRHMAEHKYGSPSEFFEEYGEEGHEVWKKKLHEMADGFDAARKLIDLDYDVKDQEEQKRLQHRFDLTMDDMKKYFFSLWD